MICLMKIMQPLRKNWSQLTVVAHLPLLCHDFMNPWDRSQHIATSFDISSRWLRRTLLKCRQFVTVSGEFERQFLSRRWLTTQLLITLQTSPSHLAKKSGHHRWQWRWSLLHAIAMRQYLHLSLFRPTRIDNWQRNLWKTILKCVVGATALEAYRQPVKSSNRFNSHIHIHMLLYANCPETVFSRKNKRIVLWHCHLSVPSSLRIP